MRRSIVIAFILGLAVSGSVALLTRAAPMPPARPKLHDQIRSLAKLTSLELRIDPMDAAIRETGIESATIHRIWSKRLKEAGFKITEGKGDPVLAFTVSTVTDKAVPGGIAFNPYLSLSQRVHIDGIEKRLTVPTFVEIIVGLEPRENLGMGVAQQAERMIGNFIKRWQEAVQRN